MITYNDFLSRWTQGDTNYLITIIEEFKMSDRFINAIEARKYFKGDRQIPPCRMTLKTTCGSSMIIWK